MMFFGMGLTWLLSLGAVLLTLGLAANAVWRAVMAPPGLPRGASCGSCGYEMTTLAQGRCSECGADLLLAGVMTRRTAIRLAGSLPAALIGWTIICVAIASIAMGVASYISMMATFGGAGASSPYTSTYTFVPDQSYDEDTGEFAPSANYRLSIASDVVVSPGMSAESGEIVATLTYGDAEVVVTLDALMGDWVMADDEGTEIASGADFSETDARLAFATVGLDAGASEALATEAGHLDQLLSGAMTDPWNYEYSSIGFNTTGNAVGGLTYTGGTSNMGMGAGFGASPYEIIVVLSVLGVGVLIWVMGMLLIVRRRSRVIREARPQPA
ncbi:MAG: hypothetical protein DHS20C14_01720 [Phycisphaeraceae bacterium]|nr:MAG: hypothetical protein DHS20C14_01720 [Phycisphaeraceae bacterium]